MKFYFVYDSYVPNTAPANRILGFIRGFSELGIDVEVVFLTPDLKRSKVDKALPHVTYRYLWDGFPIDNRIALKFMSEYWGWKFSRSLAPGDKVFMMGERNVFFHVLNRQGVELYTERSEHPDAYPVRFFCMNKYKREVHKLSGMSVISTALKNYFVSLGLPENKIQIVNMTVDNNRFRGLIKQPSEKYIAYCGTASNNKDGVDELIKSFAIVHKSHPAVKLLIIGKTPDKKDASGNLKLIENLGLKDSVVFTGVVSSSEMPQLLKNACVLALDRPDSLQAQCGFPTKLGEYLLTENPVVVTKVGDIPLFLKDGETALLAEQRNSQDFASKIIWALDNPEEASQIGIKGAQVAMREFNYLNETKKIVKQIFGYESTKKNIL